MTVTHLPASLHVKSAFAGVLIACILMYVTLLIVIISCIYYVSVCMYMCVLYCVYIVCVYIRMYQHCSYVCIFALVRKNDFDQLAKAKKSINVYVCIHINTQIHRTLLILRPC